LKNTTSHLRKRELARLGSMMSLAAALSACGGGSSAPPPPPPPSPAPAPAAATATLAAPSDGQFAWRLPQAASVTLTDAGGHAVAGSATSCVAHDATQVTVSADCSQITALRVGPLAIDVSGGGASASLVVQGVPQRHWTGAHGPARYTALVVGDGGSVVAWGDNNHGILDQDIGYGSLTSLSVATPGVNALGLAWTGVVQASVGEQSSAVLLSDGSAQAWGNDDATQLGAKVDGGTTLAPIPVVDLTSHATLQHVVQIELGDDNGIALIDDGSVLNWGNWAGNGTTNDALLPVQAVSPDGTTPLTHVVAVSAGSDFGLALTDDGRVLSWGFDPGPGALGQGASAADVVRTPGYVVRADGTPLDGIVQISAGYGFGIALASDGTVWSWGSNMEGQLGRGTVGGSSKVASQVLAAGGGNLSRIAMVAAGGWHALALDLDGRVLAWGDNGDGQLGDGAGAPVTNATGVPRVTVAETGSVSGFTDIVSIAASYSDSYALGRDGRVLSWGTNFHGALGRTTSGPNDRTPTRVATATSTLSLTAAAYPNPLRHAR
jgi:alpha-tubulin suppressor-like RCC1 family protein